MQFPVTPLFRKRIGFPPCPGLDEEVHKCRYGLASLSIALQFTEQLRHANHLAARLLDPPQPHLVRSNGSAANRVGKDVDLVTFLQGVQSRERQARLRP